MAKKKADAEETTAGEATPAVEVLAGEKMSKKEAVQAALKAGKTKPIDGVNWIREKYGIQVTTAMFSSYKSAEGGASKSSKIKVPAAAKSGAVPVPSTNGEAPDPAKLARAVKELVANYGSKAVADMAKVFGE